MSDPRRLAVLRAIVEDYVHYREPVGSKVLVERHQLGVSSATIRNDMAALEEEGLIAAPHTSAGRIPTDKGYRLFVDQLASVKPLSAPERRAIHTFLDEADDLDDVLERSARLLSQLTRQVAVVQYPTASQARVRHLEIVALGPAQVLAVLITDAGSVEQRVVDLGQAVTEDDVAQLRTAFLTAGSGRAVHGLREALESLPATFAPALQPAAAHLAAALTTLAEAGTEDRIVLAGTANLARATMDFPLSIGPVLEALEEQVVMLRLLTEMHQDQHGVAVSIGRENPFDELAGTSVVATGYGRGAVSKVGVLGPTRMDYPSSMAAVRAVARYLSRILAN
ncbi:MULTISPECIES: heat-inducible transcriptional repressor HrcA [Arthrobacter]|uniref:Heat-inducible transcription repressor HrcA n=2 Tax=Arthrobacter TaxID=1663 RepID=A0ABU9KKD0_9MICC|nr:heat-inducible transcriptional repressor HrcA [Arthrobacter sp. YJM1]MDP5226018.1 heat-inducible transcriptional repressor HrcA [Arthrobacter sp. YJM1]